MISLLKMMPKTQILFFVIDYRIQVVEINLENVRIVRFYKSTCQNHREEERGRGRRS